MRLFLDKVQHDVAWDLTPMVDCVFLLLIFFVLVIDLSQASLEDMVLPKATFQVPDEQPGDRRPVINVLQNGAVYYRGVLQYDPVVHGDDATRVTRMFELIRQTAGLRTSTQSIGSRRRTVVDEPVLLRADKWTEWQWVGEVLRCGAEQGFWQIELALSAVDRERQGGR